MKKILLVAAAALAITSCSQNEEFDNVAQKSEIKMGTSAVTRAEPMVSGSFKEFKAFGYAHTENYTSSVSGTEILNGSFESSDNLTWTEKEAKKFYWPSSGNVTFFGYSPIDLPTSDSYTYTAGYPTVTYTVENTIANQVDFLVTKLENQVKSSNAVSLAFKHALTQVVFKLKGDDADVEYTVTNITFKDLKTSGSYSYESEIWIANATPIADYTISLDANNVFVGGDATVKTLDAKEQLMILMPQELTDAIVEVTFSAKKGGVSIFDSGIKTAKISGKWTAGDKYVYTLLLKAGDELKVSGTFEDYWNPKDATTNAETDKTV